MTINDMLEQGVVIQGIVCLKFVNDGREDIWIDDVDWRCSLDEEWADEYVSYIYPNYPGDHAIVIEIDKEDVWDEE